MKERTHNFLVVFGIILFFILIFGGIILWATNEKQKEETICKKIGNKLDLEFYDIGYCNMGEDCNFRCKFISNSGGIVVKEVK